MMEDVVGLFKKFEKYENKSTRQLENYLKPSIDLNQYRMFYDEHSIIGFVNWAYLHHLVQERFKLTGKIKQNEWNSGNNLWLIDILSIHNTFAMMRWVYNYFKKDFELFAATSPSLLERGTFHAVDHIRDVLPGIIVKK